MTAPIAFPPAEASEGSAAPAAVDAVGLVRRFGPVRALDGVSLELGSGEVLMILGRNGAGKSTLLRTVAGLCRPRRGTVRILGRDIHADPVARRDIGFVSHRAMLYDDLTPRENLRFHAALHRLNASTERVEQALVDAGLSAVADRQVRGFSRGMVQRLTLARADLHSPRVMLLDEPFTGLDPLAARALVERIGGWRADGRAVLAVSHDPGELWPLTTRVVVMARGRLIFDADRPADLARFRTDLDRLFAS